MRFVSAARDRIHAIRTDHQVVITCVLVGALDVVLEHHLHTQLGGPALEYLQQFQARNATKTMATRADHAALEMDVDVVPVVKVGFDRLHHLRIGLAKTVHGLIGEHHAPAEGVVGGVALDHRDVMRRVGFLHEDGEIQTRGPAPQTHDTHQDLLD